MNVFTAVLAGGRGQRLGALTRDRAKPAVPFGGIYRLIDFTLSNCINSGIRRVVVLTQYKSISLDRHIREGWGFLSSSLGEYIITVPPQKRVIDDWYRGTADAIYQNFYTIEREMPDVVLILSGDHVYKMNYTLMLEYHFDRKADLTIACIEVKRSEASRFGIVETAADDRIIGFEEKPAVPRTIPGDPEHSLASMGIYAFTTKVLVDVLERDVHDPTSQHDFGKDVIPKMIHTHAVYAYRFVDENRKETKYWRDVGTIDSYWNANMDLVRVSPVFNLYDSNWPIRTHMVQAPPPKFVHNEEYPGGRRGIALNSIVSQGCIISGATVINSILSPNVRVHSYAEIRDSLILDNVEIGRGAKIQRTIIDKNVFVPQGMRIGYDLETDRRRFETTESGIVVIPKGEVLK